MHKHEWSTHVQTSIVIFNVKLVRVSTKCICLRLGSFGTCIYNGFNSHLTSEFLRPGMYNGQSREASYEVYDASWGEDICIGASLAPFVVTHHGYSFTLGLNLSICTTPN